MNTFILYGGEIKSRADFHDQLARLMDFPGYYGYNLDALYDVLTDITEETRLILLDGDAMADHLEDYYEIILQLMEDVQEENAYFHFELG